MSELKSGKKVYFPKAVTREQSKDTGLAMLLILLLAGLFTGNMLFVRLSVPVLLLVMIVPQWFYPLAVVWFGISNVMGTVMSQLLLTLVYFIVVFPIGLIRRLSGADTLRLRAFKKGRETVMHIRNHLYTSSDIEKPY